MPDIEALRLELIDYYGTLAQIYPAAYLEVEKVKRMSDDEIIALANKVLGKQYVKKR